jgi:hypothetical protein
MSEPLRPGLTHLRHVADLYARAAQDAVRVRNDPADLANLKAVREELRRDQPLVTYFIRQMCRFPAGRNVVLVC